jgi:transposase
MRARSKNDRNDAYMLAEVLRSRCLDGIYVPSKDVRDMRELTRHRESLVRKKGDLRREVLAHLLQKGIKVPEELRTKFSQKHISWMRSLDDLVLNDKLDILDVVMEKIKNIESKLDEVYGNDEDVRLIRTVPGIGLVTATVIKAEVVDVTRFSSAENLAAYVGLTPLTYQSGDKEWGGHTRNGNGRVKHVLIEAMLFHLHHCPDSRISRYNRRKRDASAGRRPWWPRPGS